MYRYYKRKIFLPFLILTDTWAVAKRFPNDHRSRRFPVPVSTEQKVVPTEIFQSVQTRTTLQTSIPNEISTEFTPLRD